MKNINFNFLSLSLKTLMLIFLFAGFPIFIGVISYNYYSGSLDLLVVPDVVSSGSADF